jgi:Carboxypeptidase regulatory-like domain/TonB dependent receptor
MILNVSILKRSSPVMSKSIKFFLVSLFVVAFFAASSMAQSTVTGAIGGVVTNPNKEVVNGASVSAKNNATAKEDTATTDDTGRFKIPNLQPGEYTVTVSAGGFAPFTQAAVIVEVGRETTLDVPLSVQGVTGTVQVTAEAPVINTTQQDFSTNVNQTQINELPINGQRWSNFALLAPGTVPDANFGLISFRGISGLLNNNTVDGGDNNQAFFSEERGRTRINYVISQRAIREFQVNTSNYSAEYGRAAGGVTNAVTKSGANAFHGDANFYDRDNRLGARNPLAFLRSFDPTTGTTTVTGIKPTDKRYTFGGDIGGPIKKNKAFFFFNYDEVRRNFPGLAIFGSGNFTTPVTSGGTLNTCTSTAQANCTSSLVSQSLKNATTRNLSDAQINSVISFLTSETGPNVRKGNQRIFMPKVDINLTQSNTLTVTYNRFRWNSPNGIQTQPTNTIGRAGFGDDFVNDDSVNVRLSSNLSPTLINEGRYQWSRDFEFEFSKTPLAGEPLTAPAYPGVIQAGTRSPGICVGCSGSNGSSSVTNGIFFGVDSFLERPSFPNEKRNQIFDMITWTRNQHTLKFGVDYSHVTDVADNLRFYAGSYGYSNINDFIIDYLNSTTPGGLLTPGGATPMVCATSTRTAGKCYTSNYQQAFGGTAFSLASNQYALFTQDDWRVTPRLTLNIGLRWEYQQFPKPFSNLINPAIPQTGKMPSDKTDFGPRIGFALDIRGNGKDSLRGGYGIYYGLMGTSTIYNALINTAMPGGQFQVSLGQTTGPVFPKTLAQPASPVVAVQYFQDGFRLPKIHQADLNYEHEIARNTVVSFSLLLSYGHRLPLFVDQNIAPARRSFAYTISGGPFDGQTYVVPWFYGCGVTATCGSNNGRPNPNFGALTQISSEVWSKYVGGVVQFNRRLTNGLQFNVNYTRSRSTDTGQSSTTFTTTNNVFNPFDIGAEAGRSNFDFPNKFVANVVWQPQSKNPILKDWTLSPILAAYSGAPLTAVVSGSIPTPGLSQDASCWPGNVTSNQCFTPGGGQNGTGGSTRFILSPRNGFRLPPIWNVDMRVSRRLRFTESKALEFLIEGFNVFNRTQVTGESNGFYTVSSTSATCNAAHTTCTPASATLTYNTGFQAVTAAGGTLFRERQIQWAVRFQF